MDSERLAKKIGPIGLVLMFVIVFACSSSAFAAAEQLNIADVKQDKDTVWI